MILTGVRLVCYAKLNFSFVIKTMLPSGVTISGCGPCVVFLHSSLSSSRQWHNLAKQLEPDFTCINIDLLGYGAADPVLDENGYSFDTEVQRINSIISHAVGKAPYHLVGHSCGGAIALKMTVDSPAQVLSLSIYEPVAFHLLADSQQQKEQVINFANKLNLLKPKQACQVFVDYWNGDGFFNGLPDNLANSLVSAIDKVKLDFKGIFSEVYQLEDLSRILCPCLVLYGKYTKEVSRELTMHIINALNNVTSNEVQAGHMAPVSHPQLVEPIVCEFISSR